MHIELTEMLRCPEPHEQEHLVLSTGEMLGRMVRSGTIGCPVCRREYPLRDGIVDFQGGGERGAALAPPSSDYPQTLQALLDLSGPGGIVVLVGSAGRYAEGLAGLMGGVHFVGVNPPEGVEELPVLSLCRAATGVPLRDSVARGVVVGVDVACDPWLADGQRVLLRGRRLVVEDDRASPRGIRKLASADRLFVGEKL
ncbi:MAG TPA: hypothetical protein VGA20_11310 [Gemmatimonadales bacterium]